MPDPAGALLPSSAAPGWPPAVVAGGFQTGINLVRDLSRKAVDVHCVDSNPQQRCFNSVYGTSHLCPDPDTQPTEWREFMIGLSRKIGNRPVIIPSSDKFVSAIAAHAEALDPWFRFCSAAAPIYEIFATKQRQYSVAEELGMPVPRTRFAQSVVDVEAFAREARFPCIIKPLHCREWTLIPRGHIFYDQKLTLVHSRAELLERYALAAQINPNVVLQEIIEGPDTEKVVYMSCYTRDSRRLASCVVREIRTSPMDFGSASVCEPFDDAETNEVCDRFLRRMGYAGLCEIELKRDSRDGVLRMIEANPRYTATSDTAPYAGVELGWVHYLDLIGETVPEVSQDGKFFRHISVYLDFISFRDYIRVGLLTWGDFIRSYREGPVYYFDFDPADRRVTWGTMVLVAKTLIAPLYRRFFPKKRS